jgi:hypothetical protein
MSRGPDRPSRRTTRKRHEEGAPPGAAACSWLDRSTIPRYASFVKTLQASGAKWPPDGPRGGGNPVSAARRRRAP